jgi:hypothetical protein
MEDAQVDPRLYRNPQGFKRPLAERVLHQQFRQIIPDCVAAMFGRRGLDIGRSTEAQKEDRAAVLQAVCCLCLAYVLCVYSMCFVCVQRMY